MVKLVSISSDLELERKGVELHYREGAHFTLGRFGTRETEEFIRKRAEPYLSQYDNSEGISIPLDIMEQITKDCIIELVLLGWRGLENDDGSELIYTKEKAREILDNPALHDLYNWIITQAKSERNFRLQKAEDAVKN